MEGTFRRASWSSLRRAGAARRGKTDRRADGMRDYDLGGDLVSFNGPDMSPALSSFPSSGATAGFCIGPAWELRGPEAAPPGRSTAERNALRAGAAISPAGSARLAEIAAAPVHQRDRNAGAQRTSST